MRAQSAQLCNFHPNVVRYCRSDGILRTMSEMIASAEINKNSLGWGIEELELLTRNNSKQAADSDDESEEEVERMIPSS